MRDIDIANLSVRPSICPAVRPSVRDVPVLDENGLTYCHSFFFNTVAQSFISASNIFMKFRRGHLLQGR